MLVDDLFESRGNFGIGDPVIITGNVEYQGKTGDVREVGRDGAFVVVDLYNYGPHSFHASDVSLNDYADSDDEAEYQSGVAEGSKEDFENWKKTIAPKAAQSAIQKAVNVRAQKQALAKSITQNDINRALAQKGVLEAEKNPHTSALGRALYRDLSREKKASPAQVQRNKERWAQRQKDREQGVAEEEKVGNMPADKFDDAMARLKQLAGAGPLKTVWDPQKRVYKNMPTAVQPKK